MTHRIPREKNSTSRQLRADYGRPSSKCSQKIWFQLRDNFEAHPERKQLWMASCFGHLYNLPKIIFCSPAIHLLLLCHKGGLKFDIQGERLRFTELDFACILGLRCLPARPLAVKVGASHGSLKTRLFGGIKRITKKSLMTQFLRCEDHTEAVKLALVLFVESFLIAKETQTAVNTDYLCLVDDLESFCSYPWGSMGFKLMKEGLETARCRKSPRYNIYGCVLAFQIWAYERIPLFASLCCTSKIAQIFPRILKWKSMKYIRDETLTEKIFAKRLQLNKELVLTEEEKEQQVVKDALAKVSSSSKAPSQAVEGGEEEEVEVEEVEEEEEVIENKEKEEEEDVAVSPSPCKSKGQSAKGRMKQAHNFNHLVRGISQQVSQLKDSMHTRFTQLKDQMHSQFDMLSTGVDAHSSDLFQLAEDVRELKENSKKEVDLVEEVNLLEVSEGMSDSGTQVDIATEEAQYQGVSPQQSEKQRASIKSCYLRSAFLVTRKRKRPEPSTVLINPKRRLKSDELDRIKLYIRKQGEPIVPTIVNHMDMTPDLLYDLVSMTRQIRTEHIDAYMDLLALRHVAHPQLYTQECTFGQSWFMDIIPAYKSLFAKYKAEQDEDARMLISGDIPRSIHIAVGPKYELPAMWECERVYLPFHHEGHWSLVVLEPLMREILLLDSYFSNLEERYESQIQLLKESIPALFHMSGDAHALEGKEWELKSITHVPKQHNARDCGVFVMKYVDYLCSDLPITFKQTDISYFRKRMAFELMIGVALP